MNVIRNYLLRTVHSPRWSFAKPLLEQFVSPEDPAQHWLRIVMNRETKRLIDGLGPKSLSALEISGNNWSIPGYFQSYRSVDFPGYDLCEQVLDDKFGLIIADQVLEHVLWPYRAVRNVYQMLNPGGSFLVSVPFLIRVHGHPVDCSRWTELGLKHLLAEAGFDLNRIQTGSWGNRACVVANLSRWQKYLSWRHSLENDPRYPVMTWALATK